MGEPSWPRADPSCSPPPPRALLSPWGRAGRIWTATLFLHPACLLLPKKHPSNGSVWRGPEGSKLSRHDPCCYFIFQLFREVRIMKVLNHPNIGEDRRRSSPSSTARLQFPHIVLLPEGHLRHSAVRLCPWRSGLSIAVWLPRGELVLGRGGNVCSEDAPVHAGA